MKCLHHRLFLFIFAFVSFLPCHAQTFNDMSKQFKTCNVQVPAPYAQVCRDVITPIESARVLDKLQQKSMQFEIDGDMLLVGANVQAADMTDDHAPFLCCDIQSSLEEVSKGKYVAKFRWESMSAALLDVRLINVDPKLNTRLRYVGTVDAVMPDSDLADGLLTRAGLSRRDDMLPIASEAMPRKITVFKGRACQQSITACTVIYLVDGDSLAPLLQNSVFNKVVLDKFVFVGIHNSSVDASATRIKEMLPGYDAAVHASFMAFTTVLVPTRVENGEKPLRRYVAGYSNGGAWALEVLTTTPARYDGAIVMSPASWKIPQTLPRGRQLFIGAGLMESGAKTQSMAIAEAFRKDGDQVSERYPAAGHSMNSWLSIWLMTLSGLSAPL